MILNGLGVFLFGSALCVFVESFWILLAGRFFQGIGIAGPAVLGFVVVADMYTLEKRQRVMGLLNGVTTLAMACAPVVGSLVSLYFGYKGNFVVLLGFAGVAFLGAYVWIPYDQKTPQIGARQEEGSYRDLLTSTVARSYVVVLCLLIAPYWVFIGIAPILYMEDLGVPLHQFGYYQGAVVAALSIANLACGYLLKRLGQQTYFYAGLFICAFSAALLSLGGWIQLQDPLMITIIMAIFAFGLVFPVNILYPASLEIIENTRGRMSALIVSTRLLMGALGLEMVGYFYAQALSTLAFVLILCFGAALYIISQLAHKKAIFSDTQATCPAS
jgi:DHA1 family bicyclomycin/chloramphenicol resistance-like MFS transporter